MKWAKIFRCYNSHEVKRCGGRIYILYIELLLFALEVLINTLPSFTSISNAALGNAVYN
jgi:hypothetical protein